MPSVELTQLLHYPTIEPNELGLTVKDGIDVITPNYSITTKEIHYNQCPRNLDSLSPKKQLIPECIMECEKKGGFYTTVKWNDGTYTTVKASENDSEERSPYMAFCASLAKKLYGSNAAVHRMVRNHMASVLEAQKQKEKKERKAKEEAEAKAKHARAVMKVAKRMKLMQEASKYNLLQTLAKPEEVSNNACQS